MSDDPFANSGIEPHHRRDFYSPPAVPPVAPPLDVLRKIVRVHSGEEFFAEDFPTLEDGQAGAAALSQVETLVEAARELDRVLTTGVERDEGWEDPGTGEWVPRPSKAYRSISRNSDEAETLRAALAPFDAASDDRAQHE